MNCKEYQEIILTDYLDNELNLEQKKDVELHLASCAACQEFAVLARQATIHPFQQIESMSPPETVWQHIKEEINQEKIEEEYYPNWLEHLKRWLWPRPTFTLSALAVVMIMFLVIKPFDQQVRLVDVDEVQLQHIASVADDVKSLDVEDQVDYLAYLFNGQEDQEEYSYAIEEYFL